MPCLWRKHRDSRQESQSLQDALERLCEQSHLAAIYVFGSRALEIAARVWGRQASTEHPASDVDIVRGELLCVTDIDEEARFQLYVLRRAADLAPHERERRRMILAGEAM